MAGRAGGTLNPGRYLRLDGTMHQQLLTDFCHKLGVTDIQAFGRATSVSGAAIL